MDSICNQPCLFLIFHETTDLWVCGLTGENEHKVAHAVYVCACSVSARYFETFFSFFFFFFFLQTYKVILEKIPKHCDAPTTVWCLQPSLPCNAKDKFNKFSSEWATLNKKLECDHNNTVLCRWW